nr:IS1182 family transposase [Ligilactobacillus murinus]
MATFYEPEKNHQAHYIHHLVESIDFDDSYTFGRPFEYEPRVLLKLVLLAYSYGIFSCRKIERFARENVVAMWLTQEAQPTYRTIARFVVSDTIEMMLKSSFSEFREYLRKNGLIDEAVFIDGTKILANANKYSFVWKKNTIRYDDLNRQKAKKLLKEIKESIVNIDFADDLTVDQLDEICARLEQRIEYLNEKVEETKKISPNPAKQERRVAKKYLKQTRERKQKNSKYAEQFAIVGERNSYSKTDNDATFMRMKEDPMKNGQTKPGYNLQVAANNQFALDYTLAPNPTDMRTLIPFLEKMDADVIQGPIVADAGYGSEPNYEFIEDKFGVFDYLIPYNTMLKEETKRWRSDERKVMNWHYNAEDDYYIDPKNVRFNFKRYAYRHDTYGYKRNFKVYEAEKFDEDRKENPNALTKKGNVRKIYINPQWEYFKGKVKTNLSNTEKNKIYRRRKYEIEPIFGNLKAYLGFTRFTVRSKKKVNRQMGIALMALNMWKMSTSSSKISPNNKNKKKTIRIFQNFQKIRMVFFKDRDLCHSLLFALFTLGTLLGNGAYLVHLGQTPLIISHRGVDAKNGVQNTIPALRKTAQAKPNYIEIDIQETKDHKFVVMHDENLKQLADLDTSPQELTLAQLTALTVHENGHQAKIPSFDEYLSVAKQYEQKLLVEIKTTKRDSKNMLKNFFDTYKTTLKQNDHELQSLDYKVITSAKKYAPTLNAYYILPYNFIFPQTPANGYTMEKTTLNDSFVTQAKLSFKKVYSWTVNSEEDLKKAAFLDVDGIITDNVTEARWVYHNFNANTSYANRLLDAVILLPE